MTTERRPAGSMEWSDDLQGWCEEMEKNVTAMIEQMTSQTTTDNLTTVVQLLVPIVALFGIIGNALNLVVLTRSSLRSTMNHLEKSAHSGLVALAVSDALVCLMYAVKSALRAQFAMLYSRRRVLLLVYDTYHEGLFNVLLVSSTWLTVVMAVGRYFAVCRPLYARGFISVRGTRTAIAAVWVGSVLFNVPRFCHYMTASVPCVDLLSPSTVRPSGTAELCPTCQFYVKRTAPLYHNQQFVTAYSVACSAVGILLPLPILTVCNVSLVRAVRRSRLMRRQFCSTRSDAVELHQLNTRSVRHQRQSSAGPQAHHSRHTSSSSSSSSSSYRTTPTVIGLIILFTLLVGPSELLALCRQYITGHSHPTFHAAVVLTNFLLLVNFAVNFLLYCVVNAQFRRTCAALIAFCCCRRSHQEVTLTGTSRPTVRTLE